MLVHDIFTSISGEVGAIPQGSPAVFVRFQGCNLKCAFCDAPLARLSNGPFTQGQGVAIVGNMTPHEITADIMSRHTSKCPPLPIVITGGEPLVQEHRELETLISSLYRKGHVIQVETNGSINPAVLGPASQLATWVVDYKLPGSGTKQNMPVGEFACLPEGSWIKFVADNAEDLDFCINLMESIWWQKKIRSWRNLHFAISRTENLGLELFSEFVKGSMEPLSRMGVCVNVQIHKILSLA